MEGHTTLGRGIGVISFPRTDLMEGYCRINISFVEIMDYACIIPVTRN